MKTIGEACFFILYQIYVQVILTGTYTRYIVDRPKSISTNCDYRVGMFWYIWYGQYYFPFLVLRSGIIFYASIRFQTY